MLPSQAKWIDVISVILCRKYYTLATRHANRRHLTETEFRTKFCNCVQCAMCMLLVKLNSCAIVHCALRPSVRSTDCDKPQHLIVRARSNQCEWRVIVYWPKRFDHKRRQNVELPSTERSNEIQRLNAGYDQSTGRPTCSSTQYILSSNLFE